MDESRALRHAGWAGAASVVLFVAGLALTYQVGVDDASRSDSSILERLDDGARQAAAGVGVPMVAAGVALLLWFATGCVGSAFAALSDEFTPDPDTARALGMAGLVLGLTGLVGGTVVVAVTTRIAQQAHALPTWAVWVSYTVAVLCLSGFWSGGMASIAFGLWFIGAVIGVLRAAERRPPTTTVG